MKIGIIGSGIWAVRSVSWAEQGHEVFFSVPAKKGKDVADVAGQDTKVEPTMKQLRLLKCCYTVRGVNPAEVLTEIKILDGKI